MCTVYIYFLLYIYIYIYIYIYNIDEGRKMEKGRELARERDGEEDR